MNELLYTIFTMQLIAVASSFYRAWKGPNHTDRIMIFDLLTATGIALLLTIAVYQDSQLYLDIALLMALVSFASMIGFGYFLEKEKMP